MEKFLFDFGILETDLANIIEPLLANEGYELVRLRLQKSVSQSVLTLFIDKSAGGGIVLDEITSVSRFLSDALDALGTDNVVLNGKYVLEVSSPGLDRPLSKLSHFERAVGQKIRVRLVRENDIGMRRLSGNLVSLAKTGIVLAVDGQPAPLNIAFSDIMEANIVFQMAA
jgi:ribosome maturation factor RimP